MLFDFDKCSIIAVSDEYVKRTANFSNKKLLMEKYSHNKHTLNLFSLGAEEFCIPKFKSAEELKSKKSKFL